MTQSFPQHTTSLGRGEEALVKQARASLPIPWWEAHGVWLCEHAQNIWND